MKRIKRKERQDQAYRAFIFGRGYKFSIDDHLRFLLQQLPEIEENNAGIKIPDPKPFSEKRYLSLK